MPFAKCADIDFWFCDLFLRCLCNSLNFNRKFKRAAAHDRGDQVEDARLERGLAPPVATSTGIGSGDRWTPNPETHRIYLKRSRIEPRSPPVPLNPHPRWRLGPLRAPRGAGRREGNVRRPAAEQRERRRRATYGPGPEDWRTVIRRILVFPAL